MLETLRSLCRTLSQDPLTAQDVAHDIGEIIEDKGRDLQIAVHPSSDAFSQAQVVRNQGTNEPAYVELTVSETKNLSVKQLAGAFGDYTQLPRAKPSSPGRLFFQIDLKGMPRTCAIIADLRPNESPQNGNVARITIRRDIRV